MVEDWSEAIGVERTKVESRTSELHDDKVFRNSTKLNFRKVNTKIDDVNCLCGE